MKVQVLLIWACLLLFPVVAKAVPEEILAREFAETVYPYFAGTFDFGWFEGTGQKKLRYAAQTAEQEKAVIVLVSGRTEHLTKYAEFFYDLKDAGFSFYIYDHRGQGSSERLLADPQKGYVDRFHNYVDDLSIFLETKVFSQTESPVFIVSHSMGGTVSYLYAREKPNRLKGLVLCAPMFSINTAPVPHIVARILVKSMGVIGSTESYVFGGGPYDADKKFAENDVTHSSKRFALNKKLVASFPEVALGSVTFGWLEQSFLAMDSIRNSNPGTLESPPILILSGTEDKVVGFDSQKEVCDRLAGYCRLQSIDGAKHELLMETDAIRDQVQALIVEFVHGLM
nr:alpha/beta fold hydrolase [Desulfobulbaceae bacterium]